jgi:hypothetical protein
MLIRKIQKNKKKIKIYKKRSWGTYFENLATLLAINKSFQPIHKGEGNFET